MARLRYNNQQGILGAQLLSGGTTITFQSVPSFATLVAPDYIVLVLEPGTLNEEVVHLTAYTSGQLTGTVARSQEGSPSSLTHAFSTTWQHGPTSSDFWTRNVTVQTAAYTAKDGDVVLANATSGAIALTLPAVAANIQVIVKKTDNSANKVTVSPQSGTIDGAATFTIWGQYHSITFVSDGTNWFVTETRIMDGNGNVAAGSFSASVGPYTPDPNLPNGVGTSALLYDKGAHHTDWRTAYGIKMDGFPIAATINNGSPNLAIGSPYFTSTAVDAGKLVKIVGAGVAAADFKARVLTVTDSTHCVLDTNASTSVVAAFSVVGTDNTTAVNNALLDYKNWADLFTGPGLCLVNGTLTPTFDFFAAGKGWLGSGITPARMRSAGDTASAAWNGTYIMQLADAVPLVKTNSTDTTIQRCRFPVGISFGYFTPQTNAASVGWLWSGLANTSYFGWTWGPVTFDNCYTVVSVDQGPGGISAWNQTCWLMAGATKHRVIDFLSTNVINRFDYLGIFNQSGANGHGAVIPDDAAINLSSNELLIEMFDIEGWYNRILVASGTGAVHIKTAHVEHHVWTGAINFGSVFDFANAPSEIEDIVISGNCDATCTGPVNCFHSQAAAQVLVRGVTFAVVQANAGVFYVAYASLGTQITVQQLFDIFAGGANATIIVPWDAPALNQFVYSPGRGAKQAPAFNAAPAPDPTQGETYEMAALTGAVNVANPINSVRGMKLRMYWKQDGAGGHAVAYTGANWRSVGIAAQTTTLSTYTIDEAECVDGTIWRVVRLVTGQTV